MNQNRLNCVDRFLYQGRLVSILSLEIDNKKGEALCVIRDQSGQTLVVPINDIEEAPCPKTTPDASQ